MVIISSHYYKGISMFFAKRLVGLVVISCFVTGCNSAPEQPLSETSDVVNLCKDPRPQMCTMIYQPVCGVNNDGQFKTYASDCTACSHQEVRGYNEGACENEIGTNKLGQPHN